MKSTMEEAQEREIPEKAVAELDYCLTPEAEAREWNAKAAEDVVRNHVAGIPAGMTPRQYNRSIISGIELKHDVAQGSIMSLTRKRKVIVARRDAIAAIRQANPHWSYERLGAFFKLDHSTIIHHLQVKGEWKEAAYGPRWAKRIAALNAAMAVGNITTTTGE